ncbi:MAG: sulfite exporter TauE/SafE family protein [Anaerolineae bacterium]|nr:sulfite exporter TauE/SafE family protein [Anaerolineae bacterium]
MTEFTLIILFAGLLVGLAKGGLGPLGAVITPLVVLAMPDTPQQAVGQVLLLLIVGDWFALYVYWGQWEGQRIRLLLIGAVVGIVLGVTALAGLPADLTKRFIGIIGLLMAAYTVLESRLHGFQYQARPWHATLAGSVTGFTSALANAGGPPFNAYMLLQGLEPRQFVATGTLFFATVNLIKLPFFFASGTLHLSQLPDALPGLLLVPVGVWLGKQVVDRINRNVFQAMIWVGLVLSSVLLLR